MDWTEWIALGIVAIVGIFLLLRLFSRKKRRACCSKDCSVEQTSHDINRANKR